MSRPDSRPERLRLAEPLAALSLVTDRAVGYPDQTALRACVLAVRTAEAMGVGDDDARGVYWVTLLRYVACTSTAHESAMLLGGDDVLVNRRMAIVDALRPAESAPILLSLAGRGAGPGARARAVARVIGHGKELGAEIERAHCEVAGRTAERLGFEPGIAEALYQIGERWDGKGEPHGLAGERIAPATRFALLAHVAVEAHSVGGADFALATVRRLAGRKLDPAIADTLAGRPELLDAAAGADDPWLDALAAEPEPPLVLDARRLDDVARGFADLVDLKTPYLHGHAAGVAELAESAARVRGASDTDVVTLRRAALLHDLGRAAVATGIWEKPGPLSAAEWEQVRLHPYVTERILARSETLAPLARLAGMHHERLDGSGYHRGAAAMTIDANARLLAAADVYRALVEDRPHRAAFAPAQAADELEAMARRGLLDPEAVAAVCEAAGRPRRRGRSAWPAGLTDREVEVLRLLVLGLSKKEVARRLVVSPSTVHTHVVHVYEKVGVSTRAGAALFAMEHGLVRPEKID